MVSRTKIPLAIPRTRSITSITMCLASHSAASACATTACRWSTRHSAAPAANEPGCIGPPMSVCGWTAALSHVARYVAEVPVSDTRGSQIIRGHSVIPARRRPSSHLARCSGLRNGNISIGYSQLRLKLAHSGHCLLRHFRPSGERCVYRNRTVGKSIVWVSPNRRLGP